MATKPYNYPRGYDPDKISERGRDNLPTMNKLFKMLEDPRSTVSILPKAAQDAVLAVPDEILELDEEGVLDRLGDKYTRSASLLESLRMSFWIEHDRVIATRTEKMNMAQLYLGVCSQAHFYEILKDHLKVAFILTRPVEYEVVMNGLLNLATRKIKDVLNIPIYKDNGTLQDPKVIELVLKASAMVELRTKGNYVQRTENKSLVHQKNETSYSVLFDPVSKSPSNKNPKEMESAIDAQIKALEEELRSTEQVLNHAHEQIVTDTKLRTDDSITAEYTEVEEDGEKF